MLAGHRHVVEEDVAVRAAAGRGLLGVQQEARAGVRAALDDEQRRPGGQRVDRRLVGRATARTPPPRCRLGRPDGGAATWSCPGRRPVALPAAGPAPVGRLASPRRSGSVIAGLLVRPVGVLPTPDAAVAAVADPQA